jgi:type II secretory pathway pseudopilin PulG
VNARQDVLEIEFEGLVMTQTTCGSQTILCGSCEGTGCRDSKFARGPENSNEEGGYALVALLVVMSLLAFFAMTAASNVKQQAQREREKEAIFRGEQVADAIRLYYRSRGAQGTNSLPTEMEQLLEGIQIPGRTKKLQILRVSAAKDPLSRSGEWKLIGPTSQDVAELVRNLTVYSGGVPPTPRADFRALASVIPQMMNILDDKSEQTAPGGEDDSASSSGPFLGVTSRSQRNSVITYYGINRHDEWIFTPLFR